MKKLRSICDKHKIILIFDEVITGMRYPSLSVAKKWSIYPDLICLAKACGNGYKCGIVAGRADILDSDYFVSGTYFGHIPTLKAIEVCLHLSKHDSKYDAADLNERALLVKEQFNAISPSIIRLDGWGARMNFVGSDLNLALFRQSLIEARIFTKNTFFLNHASKHHTDDFLMASHFAIKSIADGKISLKGAMPRKPVSQLVRERR